MAGQWWFQYGCSNGDLFQLFGFIVDFCLNGLLRLLGYNTSQVQKFYATRHVIVFHSRKANQCEYTELKYDLHIDEKSDRVIISRLLGKR